MNRKQIAVTAVLIAFLAQEAYALYVYGYLGFFETLLGSIAGASTFLDLVVALGLVCVWMTNDAREHNVSPIPYLLITLALGSAGPLLYLIRRFADRPVESPMLGARPLSS